MQKVEGAELKDLVAEAAGELIRRKRDEAIDLIKKKLVRVAMLTEEIKKLNNEQTKLQVKLDNSNVIIAKLREGDWSVLQEEKEQQKQPQE